LSLWDRGGKRLFEVNTTGKWSGPIAFSPDGRSLAAATRSGGIRLLEAATGQERHLLAEKVKVRCLAFSPDGRWLACGLEEGTVCLYHLHEGKFLHRLMGHQGAIRTMAFSPDSKLLATGSQDSTILLWKTPDAPVRAGPEAVLAARQLDGLWSDLDKDSAKAYRAVLALTARPRQAVALLVRRFPPAVGPAPAKVNRLIDDLDSDDFQTRQRASEALAAMGSVIAPVLEKALANNPSPEVRRRLLQARQRATGAPPPRELRAIEVLESIRSREARRLLESLARGSPGAARTREAKAALARLGKMPAAKR
jgi:hypothetical protein